MIEIYPLSAYNFDNLTLGRDEDEIKKISN